MTREEKKAKTIAKRRAIFGKLIAKNFPGAEMDDEAQACFWVGFYRSGKYKNPTTEQECWEIDTQTGLRLFLYKQPHTGSRYRYLGEIRNGVLHTWRNTSAGEVKQHLHIHPRLNCYTIARYPIANAARLGFHSVEINGGHPMSVSDLLDMPEVPAKESGGYERQIQILGVK